MSSTLAKAFWIVAPRRGEIRCETLAAPRDGEVLVRTLYSGISRGTETLVWRGDVPPGEAARMRAPFQVGDFPGPLKYGYCNVGVVEAGAADWLGARVFCLYPHQTRYCVAVTAVQRIPAVVPSRRALLAANLETALNGVWDAGVRPGDRVSVVGAGVVGLLSAWLVARMPGCRVELVDIDARRAGVAQRCGLHLLAPEQAQGEADVVIHASASAAGLTTALRLAGFEAVVVELSWYGRQVVAVPLGEAFHSRRLTLLGSQVGHVAHARRSRWSHRRRLELALELLADPVLDALVSRESRFDDLPAVMARLAGEAAVARTQAPRQSPAAESSPDDEPVWCHCIGYP